MQLKHRNPGRLEGKVVIYATLGKIPEQQVFAIYLTNDLDEQVGHSRILNKTELLEGALSRWYVQKSDDPKDVQVMCAWPIDVPSLEALVTQPSDLMDMGEYSAMRNCLRAAQLGAELYVLRWGEQVRHAPKAEETKQQGLTKLSYKDVATECLMGHFQREYVASMFHALESSAQDTLANVKNDFLRFSAGAHFYQDVQAVCGLFVMGQKVNLPLLHAYLEKIDAISNENLGLAAELRDKIIKMSTE